MTLFKNRSSDPFATNSIEPFNEMAAYEALWAESFASFQKIAIYFREHPGVPPSELVDDEMSNKYKPFLKSLICKNQEEWKGRFGLWINGTLDYPDKLRQAKDPVELLYFVGNPDLVRTRSVAIVGTRKPSPDGLKRTDRLARCFAKDGFTVVSGLAKGIDTQAHISAIDEGGKTIAVIGTSLDQYYPPENKDLQNKIAEEYLLISQVPFVRYGFQKVPQNRLFFPQRNITMSALTEATVIVEAGETSGTLIQARAALEQGRKLFILNSCFENTAITWPTKYEKQGAIRVEQYSDIQKVLSK